MEDDTVQTSENSDNTEKKPVRTRIIKQKPSPKIPLIITLIGIFCYLGVILPSVLESSAELLDYTTFDFLLMVGGAALVGLGTYFWFKVKNKYSYEEESKSIEPV
jgi:hypothetical protein